MRWRLQETH